jgi:hypothetical protein
MKRGKYRTGDPTTCVDCGYQTQPRKAKHNYEQYIVRDSIWRAARMRAGRTDKETGVLHGGGGCLCVGCIEKRLGRRLQHTDFRPHTVWLLCRQIVDGWTSPRLAEAVLRFKASSLRGVKLGGPYKKHKPLRMVQQQGAFFGGFCALIVETPDGSREVMELVLHGAGRHHEG